MAPRDVSVRHDEYGVRAEYRFFGDKYESVSIASGFESRIYSICEVCHENRMFGISIVIEMKFLKLLEVILDIAKYCEVWGLGFEMVIQGVN